MTLKMAKPRCGRILAREAVRFQCHFCKAVWEFRGSEFLLWFIILHAGGSLCPVSDKEMGAFLTLQIKKGKENQAAPKLLGHVDSVMIHKTSAMATHCQTVEWAAWESWGKPLCLLYLARASPWPRAPQYCGGNPREDLLFFHRSRSCQSGAQNSYLQLLHLSRKAAWSEQDSDGWESAGKGKGHVGWKNWSGRDREPKMEFLLHSLIGFPWVNSNTTTVDMLIESYYEIPWT